MVWRGGRSKSCVYIYIYTLYVYYMFMDCQLWNPLFWLTLRTGLDSAEIWGEDEWGFGWSALEYEVEVLRLPMCKMKGTPPLECCIWWEVYTLIKPWQGGGIHPTDASSNSTVEMFVGFRCSWHIEKLETNHWETGDKLPGLSQKHSRLSKIVGEPQMTTEVADNCL